MTSDGAGETRLPLIGTLLDQSARDLAQLLRSQSPPRELAQPAREALKKAFDHSLLLARATDAARLDSASERATGEPASDSASERAPGEPGSDSASERAPGESGSDSASERANEPPSQSERLRAEGLALLREIDRLCDAIAPLSARGLYRDGWLGLIRLVRAPTIAIAVRSELVDGIVDRYTRDSSIETAMESLVQRLQIAGYKVPERPESKVAQSFQLSDEHELIWGQVRRA